MIKVKTGTKADLLKKFVSNENNEIWVADFNEEIVVPWDGDIDISVGKVTITGNVAPGGGNDGKCVCTYNYDFFVKEFSFDVGDVEDTDLLNQIFENA